MSIEFLEALAANRPDWMARAACRGLDAEVFFPRVGKPATEARRICGGCPVQAECADYAIDQVEPFGIWGGLTERERRSARADRGLSRSRTPTTNGSRTDPARLDRAAGLAWKALDQELPVTTYIEAEEGVSRRSAYALIARAREFGHRIPEAQRGRKAEV